jgi:hypothetical protein
MNRWSLGSLAAVVLLGPSFGVSQVVSVTVDAAPGHATNSFSPLRALGAGVDGVPTGTVDKVYTPQNIPQMLSAGYGPLTYRLYTELSVQDWHWNPQGTYSGGTSGYWTSSTTSPSPIAHSHGYNLPRSGFTTDQGSNSGYSRLDDGDDSTFWKSNPYLTHAYTGEPDSMHPGWVVFDLGALKTVNAMRINWANPYAVDYQVQYFTGSDAIYNQGAGTWVTFPTGNVTGAQGGTVTLPLGAAAQGPVEYIRVLMTLSSGTCTEKPALDPRDCMGFAINEIGIGTLNGDAFTDLVVHEPNQNQTLTYCSSVDPWHDSAGEETDEEQAGLDLLFTSGITRGLPAVIPVTMLYGTPQDSANELAYVLGKGYNVGYVELGEEPDGQYILPEDYAALYLQWAAALHTVNSALKLGGPILQADLEVTVWPNAGGNTSWVNRFLNYLKSHNGMGNLAFFSYEHYPYNPCGFDWKNLLIEPGYTTQSLKTWWADGLPRSVPIFVTETNVSWDYQEQQVAMYGALWYPDFVGTFLTAGGTQAYYYEYEPLPLFSASECNSWGNYGMFVASNQSQIEGYDSQFFSAQMLTQQWAEPLDATHYTYFATTNLKATTGESIVTAYALLRPDGLWSLMLINKDETTAHPVSVTFQNAGAPRYFSGSVTQVTFGRKEYIWHPDNADGYPSPDGPAVTTTEQGGAGAVYNLPPGSLTVLRGTIQ